MPTVTLLYLFQVQALSAVTGGDLQATAAGNPWLNHDMHQQATNHSVHTARAHLSQTAIPATANAPSAMVYPSASLNYLPQPVEYSLPAFSKRSAQPDFANYGHAAHPWTQHKLQLQSAAAMNQSSVGPRQPACLPDMFHQSSTAPQQPACLSDMLIQSSIAPWQPACLSDMLNSHQRRQYVSVPTSTVSHAAHQHQQLQLQAAAAAALQNAVHLYAGALQSDYGDHSFDTAVGPFTSSATLRGSTPVACQMQPRISLNTALQQQQHTGHAPTVCSHASSVPVMLSQHGQHSLVATPNASMYIISYCPISKLCCQTQKQHTTAWQCTMLAVCLQFQATVLIQDKLNICKGCMHRPTWADPMFTINMYMSQLRWRMIPCKALLAALGDMHDLVARQFLVSQSHATVQTMEPDKGLG